MTKHQDVPAWVLVVTLVLVIGSFAVATARVRGGSREGKYEDSYLAPLPLGLERVVLPTLFAGMAFPAIYVSLASFAGWVGRKRLAEK